MDGNSTVWFFRYALTCANNGKREKSKCRELDLTQIKNMSFAKPDGETFPFPELARFAIKEGGTLPAVMNAANETAVELFLKEKISFLRIFDLVQKSVSKHKNIKEPNISDIINASNETAEEIMNG